MAEDVQFPGSKPVYRSNLLVVEEYPDGLSAVPRYEPTPVHAAPGFADPDREISPSKVKMSGRIAPAFESVLRRTGGLVGFGGSSYVVADTFRESRRNRDKVGGIILCVGVPWIGASTYVGSLFGPFLPITAALAFPMVSLYAIGRRLTSGPRKKERFDE